MPIASALDDVLRKMSGAATRSGKNRSDILLVAVSKKKDISLLKEYEELARSKGLPVVFGESYVQELRHKKGALSADSCVHMIGPLQSNKIRDAVAVSDVIESAHSSRVIDLIAQCAHKLGKYQKIFLQVNIGNEPQKSGFNVGQIPEAIRQVAQHHESLELLGLMAIPPYDEEPERSRPYFRALADLRKSLLADGLGDCFSGGAIRLSMGMSADFEIAIEEGADLVRVGSALFGER